MNVAVGLAVLAVGAAGVPLGSWHVLAALAISIVAAISVSRFPNAALKYGLLFVATLFAVYVQHATLPVVAVVAGIAFVALALLPPRDAAHKRTRLLSVVLAVIATAIVVFWKPAAAIGFVAVALSGVRGARTGDVAMLYGALTGTALLFFG